MIDKIMIVAHPDDEALFGGAELLSHPDEYKVVVIDEYHNDIRRREFLDSMRYSNTVKIIVERNLSMSYLEFLENESTLR